MTLSTRAPRRLSDQRGAVAVLFALTLIVIFAAVAFVVDISRLYHARQVLQNAVDLGALAGAAELPAADPIQGTAAETIARRVAIANAPQLASTATLNVTFKCIVGDRDQNQVPDVGEVPFICGPSAGTWPASSWTYRGSRAAHSCNPFAGDNCNTIRLSTSESVNYFFAPVIGINHGNTGAVSAVSCKGACGAAASPVDVVMVLDRTGSMTAADITNMKNAAVSVLSFYDSSEQWVGLVALPYGQNSNKCNVNDPQTYPQSNYQNWQVVPLSNNFTRPDGTLNTASQIVQSINCLQRAGSPQVTVNGTNQTNAGHTNLGDPLDAARDMLRLQGRPEVPDVIIFETDGQANQPNGLQPCNYLNTKANAAKAADQTIFTIAFGLDSPPVRCSYDTSGPFRNAYATLNIAAAATQPSIDDVPGGCGPNENQDGDWYFCTPAASDLEPVFRQVAAAAIQTSHLVEDF
jgi:Putative Flp pilus-assembly TadE/G-like/von Willebrand factor type A domain